MAVDEVLLLDAIENGDATLRFYQWREPTLSLGYFQHYEDRNQHAASRASAVIRRQSGGGAILHDRELTYSLVLPPGHPLASQAGKLYETVHEAFITALRTLSESGVPGQLQIRGESSVMPAADEPFLCFQRKSPGDVVLTSAIRQPPSPTAPAEPVASTIKVLGSAQRRHRGAILQHGSLLLETSPAAPELPGLLNLVGRKIAVDTLVSVVRKRLTTAVGFHLVEYQLSKKLQSKAGELANQKYASASWTNRR
jgi:lipoate-protein ligase A